MTVPSRKKIVVGTNSDGTHIVTVDGVRCSFRKGVDAFEFARFAQLVARLNGDEIDIQAA
ncbi:hypothetical protein [Thalassovita sp.]|uniref:hypothetical protein n=1 Tax=Thalassovita sp. TaxID=1979401 RepID=UPI002AAF8FFE|nr:hypothetical protein [Thalassovita sp.]